jgi:hypothetical protein
MYRWSLLLAASVWLCISIAFTLCIRRFGPMLVDTPVAQTSDESGAAPL